MASEGQNKPPEVSNRADAATSANHAFAAAAPYPNSTEWQAVFPYVWPGQHVMPAYGAPIPYSPYHSGPYYAHPSMPVSVAYAMGESEGKQTEDKDKNKGSSGSTPEKSRDGGKGTSGSGNMTSRSSNDGSDDSSETRYDDTEPKGSSAKKRKYVKSYTEGESSQALALYNNNNNGSTQYMKGKAASKLPVSAPGRTAVATPATSLHMGMDIWNTSHTTALALNSRLSDVAQVPMDERELKRERRKQSNRESARRSRLRKQQECEELGKKVKELSCENSELKAKVLQLKGACENLESENKQLMEEMIETHGPEIITTLCLNACSSNVKSLEENRGNANSNQNNSESNIR